jgi:tight adherence protein B
MAREVEAAISRSCCATWRHGFAGSRIRQEMEARQSWITNAAKLGVAAPWVVLVLLASRREAALAYNTLLGTWSSSVVFSYPLWHIGS